MKIVHIGPPPARLGGPAGYLAELRQASIGCGLDGHQVLFPPPAPGVSVPERPQGRRLKWVETRLRRLRRTLYGAPHFYRPSEVEIRKLGGVMHRRMLRVAAATIADAGDSIKLGLESGPADVLFTHEMFCAERVLKCRTPRQQVWLMIHSPMPQALYFAWSWGVPEWDWREILKLPDVQTWIDRELDICARVDRIILPCQNAADELVRAEPRFAAVLSKGTYLLTGAAAPPAKDPAASPVRLRRHWHLPVNEPVGLYLGNTQPYRGFDILLRTLALLPGRRRLPGVVAGAGPSVECGRWVGSPTWLDSYAQWTLSSM
ncbi:MAG: hypothetical protein ACE5I7_16915 [Candidatus Binatia bacterium]